MSVNLADKLSVRVVFRDNKKSSGFLYPVKSHTYVFTAKHAICKSEPEDCKLKGQTCDVCIVRAVPKTKIKIDKPDVHGFKAKRIKEVLQSPSKDLAILILKDSDHNTLPELPTVKIFPFNEIFDSDKFVSCGYPAIAAHKTIQPIHYSAFSRFRENKLCFQITNDTVSNLECSQENLAGNSGSGIIRNDNNDALLLGIYTDTGNMATCYGEIIDHTVSDLLTRNRFPKLELENANKAFKTLIKSEFTKCFSKVEHEIDMPTNRDINLYRLSLVGKEYDYEKVRKRLVECVPLFTLTRKQINKSREESEFTNSTLQSVKDFLRLESKDKVPELLLQGFLETYLNAPKLYSSHQNQNATFQGAHINFCDNGNMEIIHCLAVITPSLESAFQSSIDVIMKNFPKLKPFGGLIDNGLLDSHFSDEENEILKKILIPTRENETVDYQDRLAIFIGYDRHIETELMYMQQVDFVAELEKRIIEDVKVSMNVLQSKLDHLNIVKATIDCFFVPFENTESFNQEFIESLK